MWSNQNDGNGRMPVQHQPQYAPSYNLNHYSNIPHQQQQQQQQSTGQFHHSSQMNAHQAQPTQPSPPNSSPLPNSSAPASSDLLNSLPKVPEAKNTLISVGRDGKSAPVSGASFFNTPIDSLVRELQIGGSGDSPEEIPQAVIVSSTPGQIQTPNLAGSSTTTVTPSKKTHTCPECHKSFSQKAQLTTHMRAHTDEKPYLCPVDACGQRFTQQGNMRTHLRRHTGERPYICEKCGKSFAQSGNLRAHEATHNRHQYFTCLFANCGKRLTQLGNLKSHHNRFHAEELRKIMDTLRQSKEKGQDLPKYERDLCVYIADLYKNSNRGIKGRGKNRRIADYSMRSKNSGGGRVGLHISASTSHSSGLLSPASSLDHSSLPPSSAGGAGPSSGQMSGFDLKVPAMQYTVHQSGQTLITQNLPSHIALNSSLDCSSSTHSPVGGVLTPPPDQPGWAFRPDINRAFSHTSTATSDSHHSLVVPSAEQGYHHQHQTQASSSQPQYSSHPHQSQQHYSSPHLQQGGTTNSLSSMHMNGHQLPSPTNLYHSSDGALPPPTHPNYHPRHGHYSQQQQQQQQAPTSHPSTAASQEPSGHSYSSYSQTGSPYGHHQNQMPSSMTYSHPHHSQPGMGMSIPQAGPAAAGSSYPAPQPIF